eukprot:CAMPEP_0119051486 /NCGR_PEP_ID=MMETSP1177-20130426/73081_1 /TAXON_ID=2985 /ORGANISM="Ochromonas sp, Strain CCMP1899" /LENGTH=221 /DNA_ID=CAMNT_0007030693 /DNA_START=418 /DNA_END=1084 /DNA_ORIENTATION=+
MSTSKDVIISRQAADYEPSEPAAMVAKSSIDTFSTPGIALSNSRGESVGRKKVHGYKVAKSLQTYKDLNGDMLVPSKFVVPANDMAWPKETWDMNLGSVVTDIRRGRSYLDKRADLEGIGFEFNRQKQSNRYELVRLVLLKYKDINGHLLASSKFKVPADDIKCPEETCDDDDGNDDDDDDSDDDDDDDDNDDNDDDNDYDDDDGLLYVLDNGNDDDNVSI